ncbi:max dimerization protein 3 isoform X1 [Falco naumanni]|uniref:max dimerization protein 3 isoform X1 n=1 Tax=Falco naumanni TaxID=148594 RepID=UPI001ADEBE3B|nr:max dimerization protein 3 isoform X1 [Falco naumanni]
MEPAATSIQVLLRAAEFLERRERGAGAARYPPCLAEAEHRYASLCPARARRAVASVRSVHNALEKHRRAKLRCCLERLKQQVPVGAGPDRPTTLTLLHRARLHIQRLEKQELSAQRAKDRLRNQQRSLQQRLQRLLSPASGERARANSLDSSQLSEPSEGEDAEIEVDGMVFSGDPLPGFSTGRDHSYSSPHSPES